MSPKLFAFPAVPQKGSEMNDVLKSQATAAAAKVSPEVGLDPALILTIITTVLPMLINCFKREEEPDPVKVQAALVKAHSKNPEKLRRRLRVQVDRKSPEPIDKGQALAIADAIIAQALDVSPSTVAQCCGG